MQSVVVEGVADTSSGPGALLEGTLWCGVVFLCPWQGPNRKVMRDTLRVLLPASATSSLAILASSRVQDGAAYRISVELLPKRAGMMQSARLCGPLKRAVISPELAAVNASMNDVVKVRDPWLGSLQRAPKSTCFIGRLRMLNRVCALTIWQNTGEPPEKTIQHASRLIQRLESKIVKLPLVVAKKMIELANEWRDDVGRSHLTTQQLQRRLRLAEISIEPSDPSGNIYLDYSCGDVFGEHGVQVTIGANGKVVGAKMQ